MASLEEIRKERIRKLETLKKKGLNPYPAETNRTHKISEFLKEFKNLDEGTLVGRIMSLRSFGGSIFSDLNDGSDKIQVYFKKDDLGDELFNLFE